MEFQTRSEVNGLAYYQSFKDAYNASKNDNTIWKISFTIPLSNERIRLVKNENGYFEVRQMADKFCKKCSEKY